jgi:hypothetical protein
LIVLVALFLGGSLLVLMQGCEQKQVAVHYGSRQAIYEGDESINGLGVLSELFVQAGHRVSSTARLSPRIARRAEVIVWFIQDFSPPSKAAVDWLETWLASGVERTLIVVGRDFDAEPLYWTKVTPQADAQQAPLVTAKGSVAALRTAGARTPTTPQPDDCHWFTMDRSGTLKQRGVTTLSGDPSWTSGIDAAKVEVQLHGRIQPKEDSAEVLLETPGDVIAFRQPVQGLATYDSRLGPFSSQSITFSDGQVIVVANGSFLVNMALVNHEHRKLAGALVREIGEDKRVFFLEAGGTPEVLAEDPPPPKIPTSTMYFDVPRIQNLLWHLAVLTLIICFGLFAIHGRPRRAAQPSPSDFGRHAEALGELLYQTRDASYAHAKLTQYRTSARSDATRQGK